MTVADYLEKRVYSKRLKCSYTKQIKCHRNRFGESYTKMHIRDISFEELGNMSDRRKNKFYMRRTTMLKHLDQWPLKHNKRSNGMAEEYVRSIYHALFV